jgi:hypothetical protein
MKEWSKTDHWLMVMLVGGFEREHTMGASSCRRADGAKVHPSR